VSAVLTKNAPAQPAPSTQRSANGWLLLGFFKNWAGSGQKM
jgi:hypothetical protein